MSSTPTLGETIKWLRQQRGLTQAELARRAELTAPFLCDLEHDRRGASAESLTSLATALGVAASRLARIAAKRRTQDLDALRGVA